MKKLSKINETIWGRSMSRALGDDVRKEDEIYLGNLKDINWVDFGNRFNFLVADRFFEMDGETYFYRDDIYDMFPITVKGKNIRLFTKEEFNKFGLFVDVKEATNQKHNVITIDDASITLPHETNGHYGAETMLDNPNYMGLFSLHVRSQSVGAPNVKHRVLLIKDK